MTAILVLYEDSRAASGRFGPHEFYLGCAADTIGRRPHELRTQAKDYPVRGVDKLLKHLRALDDLDRLIPHGGPVLAVIDSDRVRAHLGCSAETSTKAIEERLVADSSAPTRLTVVLLENNLESVVEAVRNCGEHGTDGALRKNLNDRDALFGRVGNDLGRRAIRDCVRASMPSVERIVQRLVVALC